MSGLEVVGLVAGIVNAFTGATELYIKWKDRKKKRKAELQNNNAEVVLRRGAPEVQNEYDADVRRLGQASARGDAIVRMALMEQRVILQQTVITLLTQAQVDRDGVFPQATRLIHSSDGARTGSINALTAQYQRMAQASPVERPISSTTAAITKSPVCKQPLLTRDVRQDRWQADIYGRRFSVLGFRTSVYYNSCSWKCLENDDPGWRYWRLNHDTNEIDIRFLYKAAHCTDRGAHFPCLVCPDTDTPTE